MPSKAKKTKTSEGQDAPKGKKTAPRLKTERSKKAVKDDDTTPGPVSLCSWQEDKLTEQLLTAITDDKQIKQGLFPSPGAHASTAKGGGKPKTEFYWQLCVILFSENPKYSTAFKLATDSKQKTAQVWPLFSMAIQTRATQAALEASFDVFWAEMIVDICPWFFDMRALIAERPNLMPTGLGNSESGIDMSILEPGQEHGNSVADANQGEELSEGYSFGPTMVDSGVEDTDEDKKSDKRKSAALETNASANSRKTPARSGISKPATTSKPPAKKTKVEEFSDVVKAEEQTRQKEIDLAKAKVESGVAKSAAKYKAKMAMQTRRMELKSEERREKQRLRAEMIMEKMKHDVRMAELQGINQTSAASAGPSTRSSATPFVMSDMHTPTFSRESSASFSFPLQNSGDGPMSLGFDFDTSLVGGTFETEMN